MIACLVVLRGFLVMLRRVFVVVSCLFMVFCAFVICHFGGSFSIESAKGNVHHSGADAARLTHSSKV